MTIRDLILPDDLPELSEMLLDSFQYPENPDWSVQEDEREGLAKDLENLRRSWWMIRIGQVFMPGMREILPGLLWEEDGKIASMVIVQRRGSSDNWVVGTVATHPDHRRRGLAHKLIEGSLDFMRGKGAKLAILSVIEGNLPAYTLYEQIGFETFDGSYDAEFVFAGEYSTAQLPEGYSLEENSLFNWRPRFELNKRIAPDSIQTYEPVEESRFRQPGYARLFYPILIRAQKTKMILQLVRHTQSGQVVGYINYDGRTGGTGRHSISLRLDPTYAHLAEPLLKYALHELSMIDSDLKVEMGIPHWQQHVADAALALGFETRLVYHRMGIKL